MPLVTEGVDTIAAPVFFPQAIEESGGGGQGGSGHHAAPAAAVDAPASDAADSDHVLPFTADQNEREIMFDGQLVWKKGLSSVIDTVPEGYLTREALFLIEEGRLKPERLVELVKDLNGSYKDGADFVASSTNQERPRLISLSDQSELFLQLYVFQCVNALFYCFNPTTSVAGTKVSSGFCCSKLTTTERSQKVDIFNAAFTCVPDGALVATGKEFVLATMELKNDTTGKLNMDDMFNCVLLTSMTAVALIKREVADKVLVPFVMNIGEVAYLFAAYKEKGNKPPVIKRLSIAQFYNVTERVEFIALLAVLLHKLTELMASKAGRGLTGFLGEKPSQNSRPPSGRSEGSGGRQQKKPRGTSAQTQSHPPSQTSRERQDEANTGGEAAMDAMSVAKCEGRLAGLAPHKDAVGDSPFYFQGERSVPNTDPLKVTVAVSPCFVKVWREGDDRTSFESITSEIELLNLAHQAGVPCPRILADLTELSVKYNGNVYHRLVMRRLANCRVEQRDLEAYAYSLVRAVLLLHQAGILHCDIKPPNVLWDSLTRTAYLVDFGHAQKELGAIAYRGTVGYTSPEVEQRTEPHSRRSDAYSVGKTILTLLDRSEGAARRVGDRVHRVANQLAQSHPDVRITLEEALEQLKPTGVAHSEATSHPTVTVTPDTAEGRSRGKCCTRVIYESDQSFHVRTNGIGKCLGNDPTRN